MIKITRVSIILLFLIIYQSGFSQYKLDSTIYLEYYIGSNKKEISSKAFYFYDGKDSIVGTLFQNVDISGNLANNLKRDYTLNANGNRTRIDEFLWKANNWNQNSRTDIATDISGNEVLNTTMLWYNAQKKFVNFLKTTYTFNFNKEVIGLDIQAWDTIAQKWYNYQRIHTVDSSTKIYQFDEIWNKDSSKWIKQKKHESNVNSLGLVTELKSCNWYCWSNPCVWVNYESIYYQYDQFKRDTSTIANYSTGKLKYYIRSVYNLKGYREIDKTFIPEKSGSGIDISDETLYYYHKSKNSSVLDKEKGKLEVYPNPAIEKIIIRNSDATFFNLIDVCSGKIVLQGPLIFNSDTIDISNICNGLYILSLDNTMIKVIINH